MMSLEMQQAFKERRIGKVGVTQEILSKYAPEIAELFKTVTIIQTEFDNSNKIIRYTIVGPFLSVLPKNATSKVYELKFKDIPQPTKVEASFVEVK